MRFPRLGVYLALILLVASCRSNDPAGTDPTGGESGDDVTPPATVEDLRCKSPTKSSLALVWTAPGDDGWSGTASQYDIRYSQAPITPQNWAGATQLPNAPAPQPGGAIETIRILELDSSTEYYVALTAADEVANTSEMSNVASGVTANELIPPGAISDLVVNAVDATSFELSWTAPGDDGYEGTATLYDARYSTKPIHDDNWDLAEPVDGEPTPLPARQKQSFVVTGLEESPVYHFAMKTADESMNWSSISNVFVELEYGRSLWVWPTNVYYNSPKTVINAVYRVTAGEPLSLVLDYLPLSERLQYDDECGTVNPWDDMDPVTDVTGTHVTTYDFAGKVQHGMMLWLVLCENEEFVDEIKVFLIQ